MTLDCATLHAQTALMARDQYAGSYALLEHPTVEHSVLGRKMDALTR
jgi:hypothetical protein